MIDEAQWKQATARLLRTVREAQRASYILPGKVDVTIPVAHMREVDAAVKAIQHVIEQGERNERTTTTK